MEELFSCSPNSALKERFWGGVGGWVEGVTVVVVNCSGTIF